MPLKLLYDRFSDKEHAGLRLYFYELSDENHDEKKHPYIENLRLTAEQEAEYALKARRGDVEAREKLINSQLENVVYLALEYEKKLHLNLEELFANGNVALVEAVERFDSSQDVRLSTYVRKCVIASFFDLMKAEHRASSSYVDDDEFNRMSKELRQTEKEKKENVDPSEFWNRIWSLDQNLTNNVDDAATDLEQRFKLISPDPSNEMVRKDMQERIQQILDTYPIEERILINTYFGLNGHVQGTIQDLAEVFDWPYPKTKNKLRNTIIKLRTDDRFKDLV